jgi:hypothetical protein
VVIVVVELIVEVAVLLFLDEIVPENLPSFW